MKISISMAHNRKTALIHIGGQKTPLLGLIMQIYLWPDTQTKNHWRKEFKTIIEFIEQNVEVKKGKRLKEKDIVENLDNIANERSIKGTKVGLIRDPEYKGYKTDRNGVPTSDQVQKLIELLANRVVNDYEDPWEVSDELIEMINSW